MAGLHGYKNRGEGMPISTHLSSGFPVRRALGRMGRGVGAQPTDSAALPLPPIGGLSWMGIRGAVGPTFQLKHPARATALLREVSPKGEVVMER